MKLVGCMRLCVCVCVCVARARMRERERKRAQQDVADCLVSASILVCTHWLDTESS